MRNINLEVPNCPLCGQTEFKPLIQNAQDFIWKKPGTFAVARCSGCGLVMTRPRPIENDLAFFYENTYSGDDQQEMQAFQKESPIMRMISRYRLSVMEKYAPVRSVDNVLDVGCSYGGFLLTLTEARDCRGLGIDFDELAISRAVVHPNLAFKTGAVGDLDHKEHKFDWIVFWESLEHHTDPIGALKNAYSLLNPGGFLCIEVPNFNGIWRVIFGRYWLPLLMPQHLFHFTPDSLQRVAEKAGFEKRVGQHSMFYPLEGVASLGIWLGHILRTPPPGSAFSWRTPFDLCVLLLLVIAYFLIELPSQLLLTCAGRSGHQLAVFKKVTSTSEPKQAQEYSPEP